MFPPEDIDIGLFSETSFFLRLSLSSLAFAFSGRCLDCDLDRDPFRDAFFEPREFDRPAADVSESLSSLFESEPSCLPLVSDASVFCFYRLLEIVIMIGDLKVYL